MWRKLFDSLYSECDRLVELRPLPKGERAFFTRGDYSGMEAFLNKNRATNLFFGVGTRDGQGGKKGNVREIPAVWCDIDFKDTPKEKAIENVKRFPFRATAAVLSGNGVHLYWKLREPARRDEIDRVENLNRRIAYALGGDMASTEAARVLRVPGTLNYKYTPPRPVKLHRLDSFLYDLETFEDLLPEVPEGQTVKPMESRDPEVILECDFLRFCKERPEKVSEPLWYAMISNMICVRPGGRSLVHDLSRGYPKYNPKETDNKILHALDGPGPHTCLYIKGKGFKCEKTCPVKAPAGLLYQMSEEPKNAKQRWKFPTG